MVQTNTRINNLHQVEYIVQTNTRIISLHLVEHMVPTNTRIINLHLVEYMVQKIYKSLIYTWYNRIYGSDKYTDH